MKKIVTSIVCIIFVFIITILVLLSTLGIETSKFNKLISDKASETKNINLDLETIKFKINPKELSLFLEAQNPKITYRGLSIPVKNVKAYIDFLSLFKSNPKIKKISLNLAELDVIQFNKLFTALKPSNFKSLLNNRIINGILNSKIDIFLTDQGKFENFISKGKITNLEANLFKELNFTNVNLSFFADKNDILIKNIFGDLEGIKISDGDIKINFDTGIKLNSNFNSKFKLDKKLLLNYAKIFNNYNFKNNINQLKANLNNTLFFDLDNTYKVRDYNYSTSGKIEKIDIELLKPVNIGIISNEIKSIFFSDLQITSIINSKSINLKGDGKYSFNGLDFLKINLENNFVDNKNNLKLDFEYKDSIELSLINYKKPKNTISNLSLFLKKKKNNIIIDTFKFEEKNNKIKINGLTFKNSKFSSIKKIEVKTSNNDFMIQNNKKIIIKGNKFDGTNIAKFLSNETGENKLETINSDIEIDFKNIEVPMSEKLKNFKLIGQIKNGRFIKISSKGDFGGNNFLDIMMKKDQKTERKYLEIYSDLTRPLLAEYSFFKGLSGGKLIFTSIIDYNKSFSKLKIENFKVVNAPGVIKLLSLADLGGLADLAEGEGLSFDILEIDMEKNKNFLKINEILALGPSVSVLMEGYRNADGITSLRGTLVPAKTLNKMISKIPVLGKIVVPKEAGEGLFGISFKMKGSKENIKTTINPIRTLTPRFIQKIIDRENKVK